MLHGFAQLENDTRRKRSFSAALGRFRKSTLRAPKRAFGSAGSELETAFLGTELFAAVVVGTLLGWFFGQVFGVKSLWPLLVGLAIGAIAGFREVYRHIMREIDRERKAGGGR